MIIDSNLREVKRRLSPRLLDIDGVSGVGLPGGALTVYLAKNTDAVRNGVAAVVESEAPGVPIAYVETGPFRSY